MTRGRHPRYALPCSVVFPVVKTAPGSQKRFCAVSDSNLYIVDAFTDQPFRGNPAGVVILPRWPDDAWMQSVAAELRHSETAFVTPTGEGAGENRWHLRWFTPALEVDLCGHATLATAHVLGGDNIFHTRSGDLRTSTSGDGWIRMDFPADPPSPIEPGDDLRRALGATEIVAAARGVSDILVQVASAEAVRAARPDMAALARIPVRGVIVTARADAGSIDADSLDVESIDADSLDADSLNADSLDADSLDVDSLDVDIVSRCFYPAAGVPEDPVTGSAHCTIAAWWGPLLGRDKLAAQQLSPRGGTLKLSLEGDRVRLEGQAVTILEGRIRV
jgi:predicted PhzF superfamily epimerase YddE/YHI9